MVEQVNCKKEPVDPETLEQMLSRVDKVLVSRGKKLLQFDPDKDLAEILKTSIGRSGTLRAPTLRQGETLMVGFHAEAYQRLKPPAEVPQ